MRKINFLFGVLAVAATGLLSSCDWSDNEADLKPNVTVPALGENTLIVTTNVNATIEVDGQTETGTNATFAVADNKAVAKVSAEGYLTQNVEVNFADGKGEMQIAVVDVYLVEEPKADDKVAQGDIATHGGVVKNSLDNQRVTDIEASITVPANTTVDGTADSFSIVAYTPAGVGEQNIKQNTEVAIPVLALNCEPDGAEFSEAVTLTASVEGAEGYDVICVNGDRVVEDVTINANNVSAQVKHFSVWEFVLRAKVVSIVEDELIKSGSILLANGKNTITYTQKYGFEADPNYNSLITNFLLGQFGRKTVGSVSKSVDITSDKVGSANYTVKQAVKTYTFQSKEKKFTAKVYGAVTVKIESTTADTSGHSGGNGK